ncbi:MAG TPA: pyrroloquinoline quinone-dependent dehydrogenase [Bryobacteraceae bacterium]|nr:pyrroloquinoline quinone-dependent dehydrogenase [Bryobacteraceae bacterium]
MMHACVLASLTAALAWSADWRQYGGDTGGTKYSPLERIDARNAGRLRVAWRWESIDAPIQRTQKLRPWLFEATPLAVNGILFTSTSLGQVAAIDGMTGRTIWTYDPKSYTSGYPPVYGFVHRGVAYWEDREDARILFGTSDSFLIALDAKTGKPVSAFGNGGRIDLLDGLPKPANRRKISVSSPPVVCRGVVAVGTALGDGQVGPSSDLPAGDVQGFDVRTGKRLWTFASVARGNSFGSDTWKAGSSGSPRGVSAWPPLAADETLGFVYLPFSTPANDYYGGDRPGNNLFGSSVVCLNARTGERVWHFQTSHHDIWDYDPPAAPMLADLNVEGTFVKALIQVTKQGFCFVLDRITGKPVWPIIEKPVPDSDAPHEQTSPTQPMPTRPPPFDRQGVVSNEDLIDFTPELRKQAEAILSKYRVGPLFTPPSFQGTVSLPGSQGGASWAGAAFDPETQKLYIPSVTRPTVITLLERPEAGPPGRATTSDRFRGSRTALSGPEGLPLFKPPFGRITAIDLRTGTHSWVVASGEGPRDHAQLRHLKLPSLGWPLRTFVLLTKTLLFTAQEGPVERERTVDGHIEADHGTRDPKLRAYDKATGQLVSEVPMPANATGSPLTYLANGKQYIVIAAGGSNLPAELIAFTVP